MDATQPIPRVYHRNNTFSRSEQPTTPTLTPTPLPTNLKISETTLPLRQLRLSRGLRRHEIAITYKTTTVFITPADNLKDFIRFIDSLRQYSISPPNYLFTRLLARGAFGSVHAAINQRYNDLAVKRVPLSYPLWRTERNILRCIPQHPNVINVVDTFTTKKYLHIVMPRLQPLSTIPQPLLLTDAMGIIKGLLSAVAHLHKYGVCHNDIKPDNILLSPNAQPVLTDFGLASFGPGKGGTHAFHAPYGSGPSADVWSIGVVAFILLTGRMPWVDLRERAILVRRMKDGIDVVGELCEGFNLDEEVLGLLKGLLQVDPRKRLSARAALEHSVFVGDAGNGFGRASVRRVFKSVLFGIRWMESLRGPSNRVGRTLLL